MRIVSSVGDVQYEYFKCLVSVVQPCGVDYELKAFVADGVEDKIHKRNSVILAIRKLTYAAEQPAPQPNAEAVKEFMMCSGNLRLEATLDKEVRTSVREYVFYVFFRFQKKT